MAFPDYKQDLLDENLDEDYILDRYYHGGPSHAFIGANPDVEPKLKKDVSTRLYSEFGIRVHPQQLVLCGSGHLGFRPVPGSNFGRSFDPATSDIDIAVVSPELFESCWVELQDARPDTETREMISKDLFWGIINPAVINNVCDFGRRWWNLFGDVQTDRARGVRGRLYKNHWSMQNYHRLSVVWARFNFRREQVAAEAQENE